MNKFWRRLLERMDETVARTLTRICDIMFGGKDYVVETGGFDGRWFLRVLHARRYYMVSLDECRTFDKDLECGIELIEPPGRRRPQVILRSCAYKRMYPTSLPDYASILNRCVVPPGDPVFEERMAVNNQVVDLFRTVGDGRMTTAASRWSFIHDGVPEHYFTWWPAAGSSYLIRLSGNGTRWQRVVTSLGRGWKCTISIDAHGAYHYAGASIYYSHDRVTALEPPLSFIDALMGKCVPQLHNMSFRAVDGFPFSLIMTFRTSKPARPGLYGKAAYAPVRHALVNLVKKAGVAGDFTANASGDDAEAAAVTDIHTRLGKLREYLGSLRPDNAARAHAAYWQPKIDEALEVSSKYLSNQRSSAETKRSSKTNTVYHEPIDAIATVLFKNTSMLAGRPNDSGSPMRVPTGPTLRPSARRVSPERRVRPRHVSAAPFVLTFTYMQENDSWRSTEDDRDWSLTHNEYGGLDLCLRARLFRDTTWRTRPGAYGMLDRTVRSFNMRCLIRRGVIKALMRFGSDTLALKFKKTS